MIRIDELTDVGFIYRREKRTAVIASNTEHLI